eukprot:SAG31_NODE_3171_length_4590_cov_5.721443_1_plen_96_part_00
MSKKQYQNYPIQIYFGRNIRKYFKIIIPKYYQIILNYDTSKLLIIVLLPVLTGEHINAKAGGRGRFSCSGLVFMCGGSWTFNIFKLFMLSCGMLY